jgi:glucan 1,3-beta-glucosidase
VAFLLCVMSCAGARPIGAADALPQLKARAARWVDAHDNPVILRGANLGNWLVQEMWMHTMGVPGIRDQHTLETTFINRFGKAAAERLLDAYRDNYLTPRDLAIIKSFGMNVVRVPFVYTLLEDDDHPFELRPDAWVYRPWCVAPYRRGPPGRGPPYRRD